MANSTNIFVGGTHGGGKSNLLRIMVHSLLQQEKVKIHIADFRYLEYLDFGKKENVNLVSQIDELNDLLQNLQNEIQKRYEYMKLKQVVSFFDLNPNPFSYEVLVIDDIAFIENKVTFELLKRILLLAKPVGVKVILSSQRPPMELKTQTIFDKLIAFRTNPLISKILFDNESASKIPSNRVGRAIIGSEEFEGEIQTLYLKR